MKDFVSLNIHQGLYNIDKYISYDHINSSYKAYLSNMSQVTEPQSYKEAASYPRWIKAMDNENQALQRQSYLGTSRSSRRENTYWMQINV